MEKKLTACLTLFFIGIGIVVAQTQVRGTVVDEAGEPVIGVSVLIRGTTQGTVTDIDGNFTLSVHTGKNLVFSYVGMQTQEIPASAEMRVVMKTSAELLDEFVKVGYMQRKITATSASVVKVNSEVVEEKPTGNPMDALQGKVAGLQVFTSSGEPSAFSSLKLHGVGSLGSGSTPLYIIDGIPVTSSVVMSTNPNDFESVQILKDAAATSIYGARAANGVIYITTKSGKVGERAKITVRGQKGVSNLANPHYYDQLMNTDELLRLWSELGVRSEAQIRAIREQYGNNNTKWRKYYLKSDVPTYQGDVSVSGGGGRTNYYISGGIFNQKGMREGSNYKKLNLRANINSQLNKLVRLGLNSSVAYDITNVSPYGRNDTSGGGLAFLAPPYFSYIDPKTGKEYEELIEGWNRNTPKYHIKKTTSAYKNLYYNLLGNITVTPIEGLTLRSQAGLELRDLFYDTSRLASHRSNPNDGFSTRDFARRAAITSTNTAQYNFAVNDNHFTALVGHEYIDFGNHYFRANASGISDDRLMFLQSGINKNVEEEMAEYAFLSFFTQISYDYNEKYFIDLVGRNDASSRFGKNKRNALFGSVGLLWKAKKELFLQDVQWLDNLDFKFSIGTQGNADIGNYNAYALAGSTGQYDNATGWGLTSPGNDNLGWERQKQTSVGVKASLFNLLSLDIEYYHRLTSDMLMNVPLPYTSGVPQDNAGFASVTKNVGKYLNQGVDIHLDAKIIHQKDFHLNGYVNFNYNVDKVVKLFQDRDNWILPGYGFGYIVGKPVSFVYPIFKQINPENGYPEWYIPGKEIAVTTKDEVTNEFKDVLEQNTGKKLYAPATGGFGISGDYKGFYMNADFTFALGKNMISNDKFFFENPFQFAGLNQSKNTLNYWKQPGDKAEFPGLDYLRKKNNNFTEFDSRMIENASFMRLKNLTIGYNLPKNWLKSQNIFLGAKLYVTGRNVLTFTKFTGPDPEVDSNLALGAYPNSRQFIVGFELNF